MVTIYCENLEPEEVPAGPVPHVCPGALVTSAVRGVCFFGGGRERGADVAMNSAEVSGSCMPCYAMLCHAINSAEVCMPCYEFSGWDMDVTKYVFTALQKYICGNGNVHYVQTVCTFV